MAVAGILGRCPACGQGRLFRGLLKVVPACAVCGADLSSHEPADGPAFFVMTVLGFVVAGGALWLELRYQPPYWLHAAVWLPLILAGSLALLRPVKGLMVGLHLFHRAGEQERG